MLSTVTRNPHESFSTKNWDLYLQVTALTLTACLLGWMIASEKWLLVAGLVALLLLIVRPIEVALGLYAFLIPFESMTTMDNGSGQNAGKTGVLSLQLNGKHRAHIERTIEDKAHAAHRNFVHISVVWLKAGPGQHAHRGKSAARVAIRETPLIEDGSLFDIGFV